MRRACAEIRRRGQLRDPAGRQDRPRHRGDFLHLPPSDDKEFLEPSRLRQLVRKYSDHLSLPIILEAEDKQETINQAKAFWTRSKSEITDEEYQAFYKHLTHDPEPARAWALSGEETASGCHLPPLYLEARPSICTIASTRAASSYTCDACSSWTRRRSSCRRTCAIRSSSVAPACTRRVARLLPEQSHGRKDQVRPRRGGSAGSCSRIWQRASRRVLHRILEDLRRGPQGRHHRRSGSARAHREAAALPFDGRRRRARGDPRRVRLG